MRRCLPVETTLVLVSGPGVGSSVSLCKASNRRIPHQLGSSYEDGHPARGLWSGRHLTWLEMLFRALKHFLPDLSDQPCVGASTNNTAVVSYINHQGRLRSHPLYRLAYTDPWVVPGQTPLADSSSHSWTSQYGSGHPVEAGAEARGMDASPRGGEADLESVWPGTSGPVCYSGDSVTSPLVLSNSSSSTGAECHGTDVAEALSVCFSHDRSAPGSSGESAPG